MNMTLVFSATQALLTQEAGATYVSCFMGRVDDISVDSAAVLEEIVDALGPDARRRCSRRPFATRCTRSRPRGSAARWRRCRARC